MNIIFIYIILGIIGFYLFWYFYLTDKGKPKITEAENIYADILFQNI